MIINYDFDDENFEYEVEYSDLKEALVDIMCKSVKRKEKSLYNKDGAYQMAMYAVYDLDVVDELAECLEDDLYDYFYDKAYEYFKDCEDEERERSSWYGTKSDVLGFDYGKNHKI